MLKHCDERPEFPDEATWNAVAHIYLLHKQLNTPPCRQKGARRQ